MNKHIFIHIIGIALLITGCTSLPTQEALPLVPPTRLPVATSVKVATNTPLTAIPDTVTPHPTLTYELQDQLFTLLGNNGNCELPCYLGITPGKTLWANAEMILEPYAYKTPIPHESTRTTSTNTAYHVSILTTKDIDFSMDVIIDVGQNGVVNHIISGVEFWGYDSNYYDTHFLRYSISEAFRRNGIPDAIYFRPDLQGGRGYDLDIVYEKLKMVIGISGRLRKDATGEYLICPNVGDGDIGSIGLLLASPTDPIDVKTLMNYPFWQGVPPFEKTSGMTLNDFYNLMVSNKQPACFSAKQLP